MFCAVPSPDGHGHQKPSGAQQFLESDCIFEAAVLPRKLVMATAGTLPSRPAWLSHKERADHAFKAGHYAEATTLYTDAVNACGNILPSEYAKLYANRALAFQRAGVAHFLMSLLEAGGAPHLVLHLISQPTRFKSHPNPRLFIGRMSPQPSCKLQSYVCAAHRQVERVREGWHVSAVTRSHLRQR